MLLLAALLLVPGLGAAQTAPAPVFEAPPELPDRIPLFPLQDVMLFPNISRPFHVFEPRYREMVADALRGDRPPSDPLRKAITYLDNQRDALYRFTEDVRIPLDNTEVERQIRIVALDRNNSLFAGSHAGARRAAVMYSIICTCALAGVDPQAYIADVLVKVSRGWPASRLEELLPHRWAERRLVVA